MHPDNFNGTSGRPGDTRTDHFWEPLLCLGDTDKWPILSRSYWEFAQQAPSERCWLGRDLYNSSVWGESLSLCICHQVDLFIWERSSICLSHHSSFIWLTLSRNNFLLFITSFALKMSPRSIHTFPPLPFSRSLLSGSFVPFFSPHVLFPFSLSFVLSLPVLFFLLSSSKTLSALLNIVVKPVL